MTLLFGFKNIKHFRHTSSADPGCKTFKRFKIYNFHPARNQHSKVCLHFLQWPAGVRLSRSIAMTQPLKGGRCTTGLSQDQAQRKKQRHKKCHNMQTPWSETDKCPGNLLQSTSTWLLEYFYLKQLNLKKKCFCLNQCKKSMFHSL